MATVSPNHDGRHHAPTPSHGYGPVPGSPTLTNPDMILPDYEPPDSPEGRSPSPVLAWRDPNVDQMDFQLPPQDFKSMPPTTPIIYGNGTMLSDIGEVTEVESTVGPSSRRVSSRYFNYTETETYGPSAGAVKNAVSRRSKIEERQRRSSIDSTSTITTQDQRAAFADFDDSVSVDDSNFQGDDEESMASSYVEGTAPQAQQARAPWQDEGEDDGDGDGDDRYSTAYISNRAERILANAKRRLTAMEGNLSRARSSIGHSDGSTPSPGLSTPTGVARDGMSSQLPNHSRIRSEDGIRDVSKLPSFGLQRSASALGAAGGYRKPGTEPSPHTVRPATARPSHGISHHPLDLTLEPLSEDDVQEDWTNGDSVRNSLRSSQLLSPTFGTFSEKSLTRSASVAQVRDIQDQMQGLRGKISSLKEQAKADSLKRRSLQSLRTPSPFTHARWENGHMEPREIRSVGSREATPTKLNRDADPALEDPADEGVHVEDDPSAMQDDRKTFGSIRRASSGSSDSGNTPTQDAPGESAPPDPVDDALDDDVETQNGDAEEEGGYGSEPYDDASAGMSDWASESGESLYHETQQYSTSHEDREDAFDYEHFFLHSAMGNIRRPDDRDGSESDFSDDSVETTKGPVAQTLRKRYSVETTASDDTFATATEGRSSRASVVKGELGYDGSYEELPPLQEVRSSDGSQPSDTATEVVRPEAVPPEVVPPEVQEARLRHNSLARRPMSAAQADRLHRPSISSFESTGTTRSFPLVNKSTINGGILTPGGSPDPAASRLSETLARGGGSGSGSGSGSGRDSGSPGARDLSAGSVRNLHRDDQIAVERLVASLGKCVLGLGEASRAGAESRMLRRRIDAARQILEGHGNV